MQTNPPILSSTPDKLKSDCINQLDQLLSVVNSSELTAVDLLPKRASAARYRAAVAARERRASAARSRAAAVARVKRAAAARQQAAARATARKRYYAQQAAAAARKASIAKAKAAAVVVANKAAAARRQAVAVAAAAKSAKKAAESAYITLAIPETAASAGATFSMGAFEGSRSDMSVAFHVIKPIVSILQSLHFEGRSKRNKDLPDFATATSRGSEWRKMSKNESTFHDNEEGKDEMKFIHDDGREVVFDGNTKKIVTDPRYRGTYNYVTPTPMPSSPTDIKGAVSWAIKGSGHIIFDVAPFIIGGTVRGPN